MMFKSCKRLMLAVILGHALVLPLVTKAGTIVDSLNLNATPLASPPHNAAEIGWAYIPSTTLVLSGVSTRFAAVDGRSVGFEIRSVPASPYGTTPAGLVGDVLRTDTFIASSEPISATAAQVNFAPITLWAGTQYFLGFRGIQGLGQMVTGDPGAQHLGVPGVPWRVFYDFSNFGNYSIIEDSRTGSAPILALYGSVTVPEPSSMVLSAVGATVALIGYRVRRRRAN